MDAAYTSHRCPLRGCGHTERANRPTRDIFSCRRCGLAGPADVVAGVNVRDRARSAWVFVNMPQPHLVVGEATRLTAASRETRAQAQTTRTEPPKTRPQVRAVYRSTKPVRPPLGCSHSSAT
ncbi:zinc ribbon domain-containing protein [Saccharopolyspora endophytica]|uniref:zinc ribbon domain-containing protein n=1 Tax=Saccharopolyspora endophytica TaxID=543886 RepID=UPI003556CCF8